MKKIIHTFLIGLCVALNSFALAENTSDKTSIKTETPAISLQFVQTASAGILKRTSTNSNQYYLTLYRINPYISYFSERPEHINGVVPFENFINAWPVGENNYNDNPPNAVITAAKINNENNISSQYFLVSLSQPSFDSKTMSAQYLVTPIGSQRILINEIKLDYVTLFIG